MLNQRYNIRGHETGELHIKVRGGETAIPINSKCFWLLTRTFDFGEKWSNNYTFFSTAKPTTSDSRNPVFDPSEHQMQFAFESTNWVKFVFKVKTSDTCRTDVDAHQVLGTWETTIGKLITRNYETEVWVPLTRPDGSKSEIEVSITFKASVVQDKIDVIHKVKAKDVPKTGLFAGKPESCFEIVDFQGNLVYRSPVQWDDNSPKFPPVMTTTGSLLGSNSSNEYTYRLLNYDEKTKVYTVIGSAKTKLNEGKNELKLYNQKGERIKTELKVKIRKFNRLSLLQNYFSQKNFELTFSFSFDFAETHGDGTAARINSALQYLYGTLHQFSPFRSSVALSGFNCKDSKAKGMKLFNETGDHSVPNHETRNTVLHKPLFDAYNVARNTTKGASELNYAIMIDFASALADRYKKFFNHDGHHVHFHFVTGKVKGSAKKELDQQLFKTAKTHPDLSVVFIGVGDNDKKWQKYKAARSAGDKPKSPPKHQINHYFKWDKDDQSTCSTTVLDHVYWDILSKRSFEKYND